MNQEINLEPLFKDTDIPYDNQKQISKNFISFLKEYEYKKNKEFGLYLLELLKEYPEIIPEKSELNFFFEDLERQYDLNLVELEKELD